jgi:hypothetical protein
MDSIETQQPTIASTNPATGGFSRAFNRVFSRHVMYMAVLMVVPMVFVGTFNKTLSMLTDPDIWWHLANARILSTTHQFIQTEPYSFTVAGQPWINPEWLSEIPYWLGYRSLELRGVYLVAWLIFSANMLLIYWRGYLKSRHAGAAFWAACLGFILTAVNSGPRTIIFGYLCMSAELLILDRSERGRGGVLWFLPPLFCIWINLHGSWLIGIALLALYISCGMFRLRLGTLEQDAFSPSDRNRLLAIFTASLAALMINPYGWRLVWNPLDMMFNQKMNIASVSEWQPLKLGSLQGSMVVFVIGLMVLANCMRGRKWNLFELALIFFAWYSAIDHMRFMFLAAVLVMPLLAVDFERSFCTETDQKTIPAMNALLALGALCFVLYMFPSEAALKEKVESTFPLRTIRSIQPSWRVFNLDYVGGRMAFDSKANFIDSRIDTFEHHGILQDYLKTMSMVDSLELLDRYRIDHVLVLNAQPLSYLLKHTQGWKETMREKRDSDSYVLYAREPIPATAASDSKIH